ncbi:GNAT family N-acetyltransferase [Seohaeicola saemankumensis]|uniref:GNAT family N-acetyltransferase n=1 Tax=Seohaeicola saemankumensis TaxID=481181 RepID=UPI001E2B80A1|nr:GNAT family N-acetyltransferase [Seohaeicola saemankumensis]MCD1626533.1 GNAT family N-acetyltransferase [Seohaeicola saemankumensis]
MPETTLRPFDPADAPWLIERHSTLYAQADGFDATFAPLVATILDEFIASRDPGAEAGWIAENAGLRVGSIFCVRLDNQTAKLRLFLLEPQMRGQGLGKLMLAHCMAFARRAGYSQMKLWTHESHKAACALYAATGWRMTASRPVHSFGCALVEQSWQIDL